MARQRNRWRLECRAAARLVRAAHGQRVREVDDVPAVIVRAQLGTRGVELDD